MFTTQREAEMNTATKTKVSKPSRLECLAALEECFVALGRLGANFDTKMVGRREWEKARSILQRESGN